MRELKKGRLDNRSQLRDFAMWGQNTARSHQMGQIPHEQGEEGWAGKGVGAQGSPVGTYSNHAPRESREAKVARFQGIEHRAATSTAEENEVGAVPFHGNENA